MGRITVPITKVHRRAMPNVPAVSRINAYLENASMRAGPWGGSCHDAADAPRPTPTDLSYFLEGRIGHPAAGHQKAMSFRFLGRGAHRAGGSFVRSLQFGQRRCYAQEAKSEFSLYRPF